MKKSLAQAAALTMLLVVASGVAACQQAAPAPASTPAPQATPKKTTWKFFTAMPLNHDVTKAYQAFAERVKERTKGQLEIVIYPAGELPYKGTETLTTIKNGFVDIAEVVPTFTAGELPLFNSASLPFLALDKAQYLKIGELSQPYWDKGLEKFNAKRLDWWNWPGQQVFSVRDISSIDQLKGLKLRTYNDTHAEMAKIWGASPVSLVTDEVPTALQRGTVDAVITATFNMVSVKWHPFIKSGLTMDLVMGVPDFAVVNINSLNALPPDVRQTLLQLGAENSAPTDKAFAEVETKNIQIAKDAGIKVHEIPIEVKKQQQKLAVPIWESWAQRTGPEAQELMGKIKQALGM